MNDDRDLNRLLDSWFAEGPAQAADRVVDGATDRIARQRQRPAWRLQPWRFPTMSTPIKLVAIGAALLAVLLGGAVLMGGGAGPTPTPTPTPTPAATPIPTAIPSAVSSAGLVPDGNLAAGDYRLDFTDATTTTAIVTVPDGWLGYASFGVGKVGADPESGVVTAKPTGLYPDPCHWKAGTPLAKAPVIVGPTVDDLVNAVVASPIMDAGDPTAITVDGHAGKQVEVRMPSDVDFAACDEGVWYPFATSEQIIRPQGPGNIWTMLVFDVAGTRLVALHEYFDGTPVAAKAEAQAILDSIRIEP